MNKPEINPAISHLSQERINELVDAYLAGENVSELIEKFQIPCASGQIRKVLPPKILDQFCSRCSSVMIQELPKRGSRKLGKVRCYICRHEEIPGCPCPNCKADRYRQAVEEENQIQAKIFQATLATRLRNSQPDNSLATLQLSHAVALLAFSRCCVEDEAGVHMPLSFSTVPYAPTMALEEAMLTSLTDAGFISVSETSKAGAITFDGENLEFDLRHVCWVSDTRRLIVEIESCGLTGNWPDHWHADVSQVWMEIALSECREFYDYCAKSRGLRAQGDKAVGAMLSNILRDFSVAQCYHIIWQGARNTADFLIREKPNRAHAANFMVGSCQRWADRARAENWIVNPFKRNFDLPRSMLSYAFFDVILKIGDRGFTNVIAKSDWEKASSENTDGASG